MNDLEKQAEELGIKVDGRWSEERLQQEIDKVLAAPKTTVKAEKAAPKTPVRLLYDTWLEEDLRTKAGAVIEVTVAEAKQLIAAGKAERADPLPGEE